MNDSYAKRLRVGHALTLGALLATASAVTHAQVPATAEVPPTAAPAAPPGAPAEAAPQDAPAPVSEPPPAAPATAATDASAAAQPATLDPVPEVAQEAEEKTWYADHTVAFQEEKWVPGEGLEFQSADGMFAMAVRLRAQFLYQIDRAYNVENAEYEDLEQGVSIRRARVVFGGNMWGEKTQYKVELAIAPADLGMTNANDNDSPPILSDRDHYVSRSLLLDWYMQFGQLRDLNVRVGQYKVPYSRDRVVSSGNLQFVDRTILNNEFNVDRDIGFDLRSKDLFGLGKKLRYYAGVYNGDGHSAYENSDFGLMYLGRVEVLPLGSFDDYSQADLEHVSKPGLSLGVAYAKIEKAKGNLGILGRRPADGGTTDTDNITADVTFKYRGLSVEGAYFWRDGRRDRGEATDDTGAPVPTEAPRDGWGAGAQVGYLLPGLDLEFAGRYSGIRAADGTTSLKDSNEAGLAISYYLAQHSYKVQADVIRTWGEGARGAGEDFGDGHDLYRLQLQTAF